MPRKIWQARSVRLSRPGHRGHGAGGRCCYGAARAAARLRARLRRGKPGARHDPVQRQDHHGRRSLQHRAGGSHSRRSYLRGRNERGDREAGRAEYPTHRPSRPHRHPGIHRQPRALHGGGRPLERGAAARRHRDAKAGHRDDPGQGEVARSGRVGVHVGRLVAGSVHRRQAPLHARGARRDRLRPSGAVAVHALGDLPQ